MTGPDGMMTKRDQRRDARKQSQQRQQSQRQQGRTQAIRTQRLKRGSLIGGGVLILILLGILIAFTVLHSAAPTPGPIAGLACTATTGNEQLGHTYVELYVNNQRQTISPGIGINTQANCSYPLTVQPGQADVISARSSNATTTYTLGQFFAIWGQKLSQTQVASHAAKPGEKVTFEVWDGNGTFHIENGDPTKIQLQNHGTIAILIDSPNAHPLPYNDWGSVTK